MLNHRPTYVALIAALRNEFSDLQRESLWIQMRAHRYATSSLGVLAQAVHDAQDVAYDSRLTNRIAQAIGDPGSILPRIPGETVTRWSTRAVEAVLAGWQDSRSVRDVETVELPDLELTVTRPKPCCEFHAEVEDIQCCHDCPDDPDNAPYPPEAQP